jgi:hypothetical protein
MIETIIEMIDVKTIVILATGNFFGFMFGFMLGKKRNK